MPNYLERYQAGEYEQVWQELLQLGAQVRSEPYSTEGWGVVGETMRRVRHNVEVLIPRLREIGYQFGDLSDTPGYWKHTPPLTPPPADAENYLEELEELVGALPLSLRGWALGVGEVSFLGYHPDWPDTFDIDPLHVDSLTDEGKLDYYRDMYEDWQAEAEEMGDEEMEPFAIEIAPDDYHKANISGGSPYSIAVPCENNIARQCSGGSSSNPWPSLARSIGSSCLGFPANKVA